MLAIKILERVESYIPDIELTDFQTTLNDFINKVGLSLHYKDEYSDILDYLSGAHDADGESATTLTDSSQSFPLDNSLIGAIINNTTDGSSGTITANTKTSITASLSGGSDNKWQSGDAFTIESQRISLPHSIISVDQIYLTVNGEAARIATDLTIENFKENDFSENYHCLLLDRILYFPEAIKSTDTLTLFASLPYTEYDSLITNTTEIDLPDSFLQPAKDYIIKECCVMQKYQEKYGYLYQKMEADYQKDLLAAKANKNSINFDIGSEF